MVFNLIGIFYSSVSIYDIVNQYQVSAHKYHEIEQGYNRNNDAKNGFNDLLSLNPDSVGWLEINNTKINYPVVKGDDNNYYLSSNFYGEEDPAGSIFMDYRNQLDELDKNLILYGHNMKDGSMFGTLKQYIDQVYFTEQSFIDFNSSNTAYTWEVFSAYETADVDWMQTSFNDLDKYDVFLDKIRNLSMLESETIVSSEDYILTLATCTTSDEKRFVIHAKLITKEGL